MDGKTEVQNTQSNAFPQSERQVQRYLTTGKLCGERPNGRWQITALALWKFQGIEQEMKDIWVAYCIGMSKNDAQ